MARPRSYEGSRRSPTKSVTDRFLREPPLGGSVAEQEKSLLEYYSCEDTFIRRVHASLPGLFVHVGPKGSGKSAIQTYIMQRADEFNARVLSVRPDDVALWSLAKASLDYGDARFDVRWVNKTLWNYLFTVEILKEEYKADLSGFWSKIMGLFGGERARIRRLLERGITASDRSTFSTRFSELIEEVRLSADELGEVAIKTRAPKDVNEDARKKSAPILNDLHHVVAHLDRLVKNQYIVLLDDLDENWTGEAAHVQLLESLLSSLLSLSRTKMATFVVALRQDIYRTLSPEDPDKIRQSITRVCWGKEQIRRILKDRIKWATDLTAVSDEFNEILDTDCSLTKFWQVVGDNPRRAIQILERCIVECKDLGLHRLSKDRFDGVLEEMSSAFLSDLDNLYRYQYPGLRWISQSFREIGSQFGYEKAESLCVILLERFEEERQPLLSWMRGCVEQPLDLMRILLSVGLLQYKVRRDSQPRDFNEYVDTLDKAAWYSVHSSYLPGLGL